MSGTALAIKSGGGKAQSGFRAINPWIFAIALSYWAYVVLSYFWERRIIADHSSRSMAVISDYGQHKGGDPTERLKLLSDQEVVDLNNSDIWSLEICGAFFAFSIVMAIVRERRRGGPQPQIGSGDPSIRSG